ncbi:dephospho-CoA kinase [Flavobacterium sp. NRK1]|uniref:dephospho-CoA kinase n=1 Tax=Flavobacterium sp. NRK1 TaxID=2954929 RepID=UPI002093281D|nr:dephospho-CoA kinase [Flavobacterium sp. NRK1]MCO6146484.1 dephospho-CoA kinase [Flavobacterium sp. NRK1]
MATKLIGLTGGIGSGKTTIANFFKSKCVPLYIADEEAKAILFTPEVIKEVKEAFGESVFTDGLPDRAKIAALVFKEHDKLQILNGIIHPKVLKHFKAWMKQHSNAKFIIREAAILFESGSYKDCDKIILVTAPKEVRIKRVMERDNTTREKVLERMTAQWDDEKKAALSDFIIINDDLKTALNKADEILKILNKMEK